MTRHPGYLQYMESLEASSCGSIENCKECELLLYLYRVFCASLNWTPISSTSLRATCLTPKVSIIGGCAYANHSRFFDQMGKTETMESKPISRDNRIRTRFFSIGRISDLFVYCYRMVPKKAHGFVRVCGMLRCGIRF